MINYLNNHSKKILMILVGVAVVVTFGSLAYVYVAEEQESGDVLAKVGDEKITQTDLDEQVYGLSFDEELVLDQTKKDELLQQMIEMEIAAQEAAKLGITVSSIEVDNDIKANLGDQFNDYTQAQKDLTRENTRKKLLLSKVINEQIGWREGRALIYSFHKYYPSGSDGYQVAGQGNEALVDKQRAAATSLSESHSKQLNDKSITFDEALQQLLKDPDIGVAAMKPRSPAMVSEYTKENYSNNTGIFQQNATLKEAVAKIQKGQATSPILEQAMIGGKQLDTDYIVFYVDNASSGKYTSLESWYDAKKAEYGVTSKISRALKIITPKACAQPARCNSNVSDNADIEMVLKYVTASNTNQALDTKAPDNTPSPKLKIIGGSSTDPAILPDGKNPANSGGVCTNCIYDKEMATNSNGVDSLCLSNASYYCSTQKIGYYRLPYISADYVDASLAAIFENTIQMEGTWTWESKENLSKKGDPSFVKGTDHYSAAWCLTYGGCDGTWLNGKIASSTFLWHPQYTRTLTVNLDPASTGSGTVVSPVNWAGTQINMTCTNTTNTSTVCTGKNTNKYYLNTNKTVTATPSSGTSITWTGCNSVSTGTNGSQICNVTMNAHKTVTLKLTAAAPSCALSASPTSINQGKSSTLSYTTTNATSASIDQGIGALSPVASGSKTVTPTDTTTYKMTASGPGGTATCSATVTVNKACSIGSFTITPASGNAPLDTVLTVTGVTNATSTRLDFGDEIVNTSPGTTGPWAHQYKTGSVAGVTYTATYSCTGTGGNASRTAQVVVKDPTNNPPTITLDTPADGIYVANNSTQTLTATVTDPDGDMVRAELFYQRAGDAMIYCDAKTARAPFTISCTTSALIANQTDVRTVFYWGGQAIDEHEARDTDSLRQIYIAPPPNLACTVHPLCSSTNVCTAPLVVRVEIKGVNVAPPYSLNMGDSTPLIPVPVAATTITHTYSKAGDYQVTLTPPVASGVGPQICEQHVIVKDPKSSEGGEVAPD